MTEKEQINMVKMTREQLGVKAGDSIVVKAKVTFARMDKLVEGEALAAENKRREGLGMIQSDKPFRSIAIEDPTIVQGQGSPLAQFHGQTAYTAKGSGKLSMSLESKSLFAPKYGHIQNGVIVEIADPQRNPSPGQEVFILIEAYGSKGYNKLGSSFNSIVFPEGEIQFYEGNAGGGLTGFGQALNLPVQDLAPAAQVPVAANLFGQGPAPTAPVYQEPVHAGGFGAAPVQDNGFGQAQPEQPAEPAFAGFGQQNTQAPGRSSNPFA